MQQVRGDVVELRSFVIVNTKHFYDTKCGHTLHITVQACEIVSGKTSGLAGFKLQISRSWFQHAELVNFHHYKTFVMLTKRQPAAFVSL